jgi:hypothetical protein
LAGAWLQARLQVTSEDEGHIRHELLGSRTGHGGSTPRQPGTRGTARSGTGDLFLDIEGVRYYSADGKEFGLQYLFGVVDMAGTDTHDRPWDGEGRAGVP